MRISCNYHIGVRLFFRKSRTFCGQQHGTGTGGSTVTMGHDRMDVVRQYQTFEGVSEEAQKLFEERLRPKTRKNYDANWRKFDNWCSRREIDSSHASRSVVINFLGEMAAMHKPESLRAYRAAIASARPDLDLSGDVFVAGLIKGARNRCGYPRGARPERWYTGMVLEKLKSWGPWSSLNLARLEEGVAISIARDVLETALG